MRFKINSVLMLFAFIFTSAVAAASGSFNLQVKTKNPWPIAASISGGNLSLKSRGRTTIHGSTKTTSSSETKVTGKANFSTTACAKASVVTVTLKFSKDGKYKSGSAKGKCVRSSGTVRFSGKVVVN